MTSKSTVEDIPQIMQLVNKAYRGDEARKGWTHEADLIAGDLRTDEASLLNMLKDDQATILKYTSENMITGCVYLQVQDECLYLGMLSVLPEQQGSGIGRKLLAEAEKYATSLGLKSIEMTVISERAELISWYERNGYSKTGKTKPFHADHRFGVPKKAIEFIILEKNLG